IIGSESLKTEFVGYEELEVMTTIQALLVDDSLVDMVKKGQMCEIITDKSPFYVERGGQVSDQGWLIIETHKVPVLGLKRIGDAIAAHVEAPATISLGMQVKAVVD